ncbi:MAG: hypothetical protein B7Y15_12145 [Bacteroidetes bacterium 24-39-8]|nr:MAG: hypothetical protein B7Y15_12145 [Bacteroidetes bacterium 24-39-8]OZA65620.1 MAG: hypothetical protein B7X72_07205 [Sphingobacteriia bacterium 39-39-8]HQR92777.1 DUF4450 domain-containing protein [Sediminibacterium sp.]HQS53594.1 DUF4450 domain-containing protein [Sediminibacterium sp.]
MLHKIISSISCLVLLIGVSDLKSQEPMKFWHDKPREIRYHPEGNDIVIQNGNKRFTRALYGTNTAFRVEAGDLPEFAMYMPGMGGNLKFGLVLGKQSKWIIQAQSIKAIYRPGSMIYQIQDSLLGKGKMELQIWALGEGEGLVVRTQFDQVPAGLQIVAAYGGANGKKFSRDGEMNVDPESGFYLNASACADNRYQIKKNGFNLVYGTGVLLSEEERYEINHLNKETPKKAGPEQNINGLFPANAVIQIADATQQENPLQLLASKPSKTPLVLASWSVTSAQANLLCLYQPKSISIPNQQALELAATKAETARLALANRIKIQTPDPYLNTLGGVLGIAADAIWESPSYLHGSIGWRMRLNGWRGPYVGDVLGWHDRARLHFSSYALSQMTQPLTGPIEADTVLHLARQKERLGNAVFSSGYISRNPNGDFKAHHYDMNLVYIDGLLRHLQWTGDTAYARESWPLLQRHLDWEKRNFDMDGDGLYDSYAAIWASDALQYSGGGVAHSSAYNYWANVMAAKIATILHKDGSSYAQEANKILKAMNEKLWLSKKGWYAEFKDLLGNQLLHEAAALWTVYHSVDSEVPDPFQAYQSSKFIDNQIPHIPVRAKQLENGLFTVSTSNWMPYIWSLNVVAMAEVLHTALAQWQTGEKENAFQLWKSALIESMYLGNSAGNLVQVSFYDAIRGETYRDFADPVAMTARSLVEGLYGITPKALDHQLLIRPGFPKQWDKASIVLPDIDFSFTRNGLTDQYLIQNKFVAKMDLLLKLPAEAAEIVSVLVNGKPSKWINDASAVGRPMMEVKAAYAKSYNIVIQWKKQANLPVIPEQKTATGNPWSLTVANATIKSVKDPQSVLVNSKHDGKSIQGTIAAMPGLHSIFLQLQSGSVTWWQPIDLMVAAPMLISAVGHEQRNQVAYQISNNGLTAVDAQVWVNGKSSPMHLPAQSTTTTKLIPVSELVPGSNQILVQWNGQQVAQQILNWNMDQPLKGRLETVNLSPYFNNKVNQIFRTQYLSPRPNVPTLQLPTQGIGEWTYPLRTANISDSGFRKNIATTGTIQLQQGIQFSSPNDTLKNNILFTSQWDNYPRQTKIPLEGTASHAYLLMAGSTNPMQSRMVNGVVRIQYADGTADSLELKNPENWWPIDQDYLDDGYAFQTNAPKPIRIHLKTGKVVSVYDQSIKPFNGKPISGGAATVLDLPLNNQKTLQSIELETIANDVVIGLMGLSLVRSEE